MDPETLIGRVIQGYRLTRIVGRGAFAVVYLAQREDGSRAAAKILMDARPNALRRFRREGKVLREIPESPNLVSFIAQGVADDGLEFILMEYVAGITLKQALRRKPRLPPKHACRLMLSLCDAFPGLHGYGLVHRDVKPENILIGADNSSKLVDLGLVADAHGLLRAFEELEILDGFDFMEDIEKGMLAGTPEYLAPEQITDARDKDGPQRTDTHTDVFALGLIFYEMLSGRAAFPLELKGESPHPRQLRQYLLRRGEVGGEVLTAPEGAPEPLWQIVSSALANDPGKRPKDAMILRHEVQEYLTTGSHPEFASKPTAFVDMQDVIATDGSMDWQKLDQPTRRELPVDRIVQGEAAPSPTEEADLLDPSDHPPPPVSAEAPVTRPLDPSGLADRHQPTRPMSVSEMRDLHQLDGVYAIEPASSRKATVSERAPTQLSVPQPVASAAIDTRQPAAEHITRTDSATRARPARQSRTLVTVLSLILVLLAAVVLVLVGLHFLQ